LSSFHQRFLARAACTLACVAFAGSLGAVAGAKGVSIIQKAGKDPERYPGVGITLVKNTSLTVTSPNGKDKLIIDKAACFMVGALQRCLVSSVSFQKEGSATKPLDLESGTVYVNLTNSNQPMSHTSSQLPPKGILIALKTRIGTYITVDGVIDGGVK
jgi:hypothetical protein